MKILVTGAAGFIGRHVVEAALAEGHSVRALVRQPEQAEALRRQGAEIALGDVRDAAAVRAAAAGVVVVEHCAAPVGPHYSHAEVYAINLDGVRNVLEALRAAGRGRLVLVSSINVLGNRNLKDADETFPCRISGDPHADVKIDAERLALEYHRQHGVEVVILRPGLVYGPGEKNIPRLLEAIGKGKFRYLGSRDHIVPMVHISDLVQAMLLAAAAPSANGKIFHVTDGSRTTIGELVDVLADLSGQPRPEKVLPLAVPKLACGLFELLNRLHLRNKPGPINRVGLRFLGTSRSVDIGLAQRELGYTPRMGFHEGIEATVRRESEHRA
jgi:nucleoside-diphosphate-sugar epimerase